MALKDYFDEGGFWQNNSFTLKVTLLFFAIIAVFVALAYVTGRC